MNMYMKSGIVAQFREPHGFFGQIAGVIMANRSSNIDRNLWTLKLLELKSTDRLLELGFGPGIAIKEASKIVSQGKIVGIDHSLTMLRQATRRNTDAIERGVVELLLGNAESLPEFDERFDKIYSANVVQFWQNPVAVFQQLRALLAPRGTLATTYMPRCSGATSGDARNKAAEIHHQLESAGFSSIRAEEKCTLPVSTVCVLANNETA